jgi:hypothetical protein
MKDSIELLNYIIANETKSIETLRHLIKEDELTILRLQNKSGALKKEIEERKHLIKEYRGHLGNMSKSTNTRTKLMPAGSFRRDMDTSITQIKSVESLEKHA